jgi:hypothetical protein
LGVLVVPTVLHYCVPAYLTSVLCCLLRQGEQYEVVPGVYARGGRPVPVPQPLQRVQLREPSQRCGPRRSAGGQEPNCAPSGGDVNQLSCRAVWSAGRCCSEVITSVRVSEQSGTVRCEHRGCYFEWVVMSREVSCEAGGRVLYLSAELCSRKGYGVRYVGACGGNVNHRGKLELTLNVGFVLMSMMTVFTRIRA